MTEKVIRLGFASYQDGSFELIVRDDEQNETTLHGTLAQGQLEEIDKILPTCVFVDARIRGLERGAAAVAKARGR